MKLKNVETLWGTPIVHLKEHSKRYRLYLTVLYLCDIFAVVGLTAFLYLNHIDYSAYGFIIVAVALLVHFISYTSLNPDKWEAFKFYRSHQNLNVIEKTYKVNDVNLYSILYCIGYKRLKQDKTLEEYKESLLSACCENINCAKSIMKYIKKYEDESGNLTCYIIQKGKKQYFIDFKQNNITDGGNNDECDNEGTTSESATESAD